jgi:hypothetical protein
MTQTLGWTWSMMQFSIINMEVEAGKGWMQGITLPRTKKQQKTITIHTGYKVVYHDTL